MHSKRLFCSENKKRTKEKEKGKGDPIIFAARHPNKTEEKGKLRQGRKLEKSPRGYIRAGDGFFTVLPNVFSKNGYVFIRSKKRV